MLTSESVYVPLSDGARLAVDVVRPARESAAPRLPVVLLGTRYWRSLALRVPAPAGVVPVGLYAPIVARLASRGYAVVVFDVRGSGASSGTWTSPWSARELADYGELVRWARAQPWSNGRLGALGLSYGGAAAEHIAALADPPLDAVVALEVEHDLYADIVCPGGIFNEWMIRAWGEGNARLDRNRVPRWFPWYGRLLVKGVRPVDADRDRSQLAAAIAEHAANVDIHAALASITCRDDPCAADGSTLDDASLFPRTAAVGRAGTAVLGWGSWYDGATADAVIRRFLNSDGPQLGVIGAWSHTGEHHASPYQRRGLPADPPPARQLDAWVAFLDAHLARDTRGARQRRLEYYTVGEERWRETDVWPPAGTQPRRLYFAAAGSLSTRPPEAAAGPGEDLHSVDFSATTGRHNRWHTQMGTPVAYSDRARDDRRLLSYTSAPFASDVVITGHPVIELHVRSSASDGACYAYLEDVAPDGRVFYLTEGQLRGLHRAVARQPPYVSPVPQHSFLRCDAAPLVPGAVHELRFGLLPVSARVRKGHRVRVALAGHDRDTFVRIPARGPVEIGVQRRPGAASYVELPIAGGSIE